MSNKFYGLSSGAIAESIRKNGQRGASLATPRPLINRLTNVLPLGDVEIISGEMIDGKPIWNKVIGTMVGKHYPTLASTLRAINWYRETTD